MYGCARASTKIDWSKMAEPRLHPAMRVGPYELLERIGSGGMAEIYVARENTAESRLGRVAIKRILPQLAKDHRFVAMFCDEARICAALSHPNIVRVVDFGEHDGDLFIAMEYVEGVSCAKLLRAVAARGQRFPIGAALYIMEQVLKALEYAHEAQDEHGRALGLVHRDVSPGNIMVSRAGEVKLTDFGIVRSEFVARRTYPGELKGKIGYMAPEQVVGAEVDRRTDLFAIGIVLSEMLVARPLFPGPSEMEILTRIYEANIDVLEHHGKDLPACLLQLLRRALARRREDRFQNAGEFLQAVAGVAGELDYEVDERLLLPWLTALAVIPTGSGMRQAARLPGNPVVTEPGSVLARTEAADVEQLLRQPLVPRRSRPATAGSGSGLSLLDRPARSTRRIYRVRTTRGAVGVFSLGELLEQVATGRLGAAATVRTSEGRTRQLGEIPAVARLLSGAAYRFGTPSDDQSSWAQPIERWRLPAVLYRMCGGRANGMLSVRDGEFEKRVFWVGGVPRAISSTSSQELFGARLVRAGVISAAQLQHALDSISETSHQRIGEVLTMRRDLDSAELLRQLVLQFRDRFADLGTRGRGQLVFFPDVKHELPLPQFAGPELVTRMVRAHYGDGEIERLLEPAHDAPLAPAPNRLLALERLGLDADETRVLEAAPGVLRMDSLYAAAAERYEIPPEVVRRAILIGLSSGWIVSPAW